MGQPEADLEKIVCPLPTGTWLIGEPIDIDTNTDEKQWFKITDPVTGFIFTNRSCTDKMTLAEASVDIADQNVAQAEKEREIARVELEKLKSLKSAEQAKST